MAVTQQQVADHLGISRMSVTRAFNGHPKVSAARRRQILETAARLGYTAASSHAARSLVARRYGKQVRSGFIGCYFGDHRHFPYYAVPYYAHIIDGLREGARRQGIELLLLDAPSSRLTRVDGLIRHGDVPSLPEGYAAGALPCVAVMGTGDNVPAVTIDNDLAARQATEHLLQLGHRRIGFLLDLPKGKSPMRDRLHGYRAALKSAGIVPEVLWLGDLRPERAQFLERGRNSMKAWLENDWAALGCTALLVQNDRAAVGAIEVLRAAGIRTPEDLSVVGFDGSDECEIATPQLSSVEVPLRELGINAVQLLLRQINGEDGEKAEKAADGENASARCLVLPTRLVQRQSTAPLNGRARNA